MNAVKSVEVRRDPRVSPIVAAVCVAAILWALALPQGGYATRYPAVPISFATFLAIQLLVPRVRWNRDRVLGPGNVAAMLFFLQLVVIPTLLVLSGPYYGTLRFLPADQYVNTALMLQALAYACYAGGYVAWTKPVRPRPLLLEPRLTTGIAVSFIALGAVGLALTFPSVGALVDYFSGQGDIFDGGPGHPGRSGRAILAPVPGIWRDYSMGCADRPPTARCTPAAS